MMSLETIASIVFLVSVLLFSFVKRKKFDIQKIVFPFLYMGLYRTKLGLKQMDWTAKKFPRMWIWLGNIGIVVGFAGMIVVVASIVYSLWKMLHVPILTPAEGGVALVLPFKIKGVFYVPFSFWIISLMVIMIVHEFAHGVICRLYNIKIKSSGFAFFSILVPLIPAAFVEPNEKELEKKPHRQQLAMLASGAFANILTALVIGLMIIPLFAPMFHSVSEYNGIEISDILSDKYGPNPANLAGITAGTIIKGISTDGENYLKTNTLDKFTNLLISTKPGDKLYLDTNEGVKELTLAKSPIDPTKAYMGITILQSIGIPDDVAKKYHGSLIPNFIIWFNKLLGWIFLLSLGIGLMNLAPLGPVDGGKMLHIVMQKIFKDKAVARQVWVWTSTVILILVATMITGFFK